MMSAMLFLTLGMFPGGLGQSAAPAAPAHVSNDLEFDVHAPMSEVAPLFGPEGERCWAGKHWNPAFIYPQPAKDMEGAVFTIQHGPHTVVWVNTIFDVAGGRMQYVAVIPDVMTFTVDVRLSAINGTATRVKVTYTRTALDVSANDTVVEWGKEDRERVPGWRGPIEAYLKSGGACGANDSHP